MYNQAQENDRLRADPCVETLAKQLEKALHGDPEKAEDRDVNWSGTDAVGVTLASIRKELKKSRPPKRPLESSLCEDENAPYDYANLDAKHAGPSDEANPEGKFVASSDAARARSVAQLLLIAKPVSRILILLEQGVFSTPAGAQTLAAPGNVRDMISTVVHHWQQISGRYLKDPRVAVSPGMPSAPPPSSAPGGLVPSSAAIGVSAPTPTNGRVPAGSS
jgi:hypothetical protein